MKKLLFSLLIVSALVTKAQYTITSASTPQVGDNNSSVPVFTPGLVVPSNGTGQLWDYTTINENTVSITTSTFVSLSSVPNASLYSGATIAETVDNTNFDVYNNNGGSIYLGTAMATASDCIVFSDPIKYMNHPFSYGSSYTDNFLLSNSMYTSSGTVVVSADGAGTLAIPNFTFNNVLKVSQSYTQTLAVGSATYTYVGLNNYFYSNLSKFSLLTINTSTQTGGGSPTVTDINGSVNKNFTVVGLDESKKESIFTLYPNPCMNGLVNLEFSSPVHCLQVRIVDVCGREVMQENYDSLNNKTSLSLNLKHIAPGIYYLKANYGDKELTRKLVIE